MKQPRKPFLAEALSELPQLPTHWLYPLAAEQRNLDLLPERGWGDAGKGCVHCKGAFVEIDQFGVGAPPLVATTISDDDGPLQVWAADPMHVVAVKLLCSLGHTTVVERSAWWGSSSLLPMLGVGLVGLLLFGKKKKAPA